MKSSVSRRYLAITTILVLSMTIAQAKSYKAEQVVRVSLQKRIPSDVEPGAFIIVNEIQEWNGAETAIIICDMWDEHWCSGATSRVGYTTHEPFRNERNDYTGQRRSSRR